LWFIGGAGEHVISGLSKEVKKGLRRQRRAALLIYWVWAARATCSERRTMGSGVCQDTGKCSGVASGKRGRSGKNALLQGGGGISEVVKMGTGVGGIGTRCDLMGTL